MSLFSKSFLGRVELEWPDEVVGRLEVGTDGNNLVDKVLNTHDSVLAELVLNDGVVGQRNSGAVNLTEASLVEELFHGLLRWVTISNVWLNSSEHVNSCLVQFDEDSIVKLSQSQKLQDLFAFGVQLVDTISIGISTSIFNNSRSSCNSLKLMSVLNLNTHELSLKN